MSWADLIDVYHSSREQLFDPLIHFIEDFHGKDESTRFPTSIASGFAEESGENPVLFAPSEHIQSQCRSALAMLVDPVYPASETAALPHASF